MFSRTDAERLRQNLPAIKFLQDGSDVEITPETQASDLYAAYRAHYGLNFADLDTSSGSSICNAGTVKSGSFELVCQQFLPPGHAVKKTAFLLHGYYDHTGLYRHLISHLLSLNIAVVSIDLPGHGLSSGKPASIGSFREYSQAFLDCLRAAQQQNVAAPWLVIGQSTGAAVVIDALLDKNLAELFPFQHYVLMGPLLKPRHWFLSRILLTLSRPFFAAMPRKFSANSHDDEFLRFVQHEDALQSRKLPEDWMLAMIDYMRRFDSADGIDQGVEILQGSKDGTVAWEYNIPQILAKFRGSRVYTIDGAGHHLANESEQYRRQAFSRINTILGSE